MKVGLVPRCVSTMAGALEKKVVLEGFGETQNRTAAPQLLHFSSWLMNLSRRDGEERRVLPVVTASSQQKPQMQMSQPHVQTCRLALGEEMHI